MNHISTLGVGPASSPLHRRQIELTARTGTQVKKYEKVTAMAGSLQLQLTLQLCLSARGEVLCCDPPKLNDQRDA